MSENLHIFGWCADNFHEGQTYGWGSPCPGVRDKVTWAWPHLKTSKVYCECPCHNRDD